MTVKILPYRKGSKSARALARALGVKRLKQEKSKWKPKERDVLINWGSRNKDHPGFKAPIIYNYPDAVEKASNKLLALSIFKENEIPIPRFTTDKEEAIRWLLRGRMVVCRTKLNGHSGEGIVLAQSPEQVVDAPLYTSYILKDQEYRVHVIEGEAFFFQRKARVMEVPDEKVNWQIRNLKGGFIYAHKDIEIPEGIEDIAVKAVEALGLDFGAVDILTTVTGSLFVLEVNTACGLEGTTLEKYVEVFQTIPRG